MAATVFEQLLAHVQAVLIAAATSAAGRVYRHRVDELETAHDDVLVLRRGASANNGGTVHGGPEHHLQIVLECVVVDAAWETAADALHQAAHAALIADPTLRAADLELLATQPTAGAGDVTVGAITATYGVTLTPNADLT